ncbi:MAG TPA: S8 family serine peptidase [Burkholderiales bacterium]
MTLVAALAAGAPAAGQRLDTMLGGVVDRAVTEQVVQNVAEGLEDIVEQSVGSEVTEQVETSVTSVVEQTIESEVVDAVQEQVQSGVVDAVEQLVESEVVGAVQEQVESGVVGAVERQVEDGVIGAIADRLEASVAGEIGEQLLDAVGDELGDVAGGLGDAVQETSGNVDDIVRGGTGAGDAASSEEQAAGAGNAASGEAQAGGANDAASGEEQAAGADGDPRTERFAADVDPLGRTVERQVWIILVPAEHAARIPGWGFTIQERRELPTLDSILLRVAAPEDRAIAQAALELALDAPGTQVDFNHVYRPGANDDDKRLTGTPAVARGAAAERQATGVAIGLVDTAIDRSHEALRGADIVEHDFVPYTGERPTAHGTAVASVLVGDARKLEPQLPGARVYAASVFFTDPEGDDAATAESLAASAEWLAAQGVRVVNMSLAGPPNRVLEAAMAALAERGVIIVAAVGNNGPNGEPLYPAAYSHVVGITAIDSAKRIYRYANRGPHVAFAALGVDIRVARSQGGYREATGTSFAAPHAAAAIALTVAGRHATSPEAVLAELQSAALDLGAKDYDPVFGFGLIEPLPALSVTASR